MAFLCPFHCWAFVFKTRTWGKDIYIYCSWDELISNLTEKLRVADLQEPSFEEQMIDNLVMDPERVETLKALANSYTRMNKSGFKSEREA